MTQIVRKAFSSYEEPTYYHVIISENTPFMVIKNCFSSDNQNKKQLIIILFTLLQNHNATMGQSSGNTCVLVVQTAVSAISTNYSYPRHKCLSNPNGSYGT